MENKWEINEEKMESKLTKIQEQQRWVMNTDQKPFYII